MSDEIDYGTMIERAYIGITKQALTIISNDPDALGKYNIMITLDTTEKGVVMPDFLKLRYPENMTVVLNNVYSGLVVDDFGFKVVLTFGGQEIEVGVPFSSILHFHDMNTNFMFGVRNAGEQLDEDEMYELMDIIHEEELLEDELLEDDKEPVEAEIISFDYFKNKVDKPE